MHCSAQPLHHYAQPLHPSQANYTAVLPPTDALCVRIGVPSSYTGQWCTAPAAHSGGLRASRGLPWPALPPLSHWHAPPPAAPTGLIMAASDLAAIFASVGISFWTQRSFKQPLLFSAASCLAGGAGAGQVQAGAWVNGPAHPNPNPNQSW